MHHELIKLICIAQFAFIEWDKAQFSRITYIPVVWWVQKPNSRSNSVGGLYQDKKQCTPIKHPSCSADKQLPLVFLVKYPKKIKRKMPIIMNIRRILFVNGNTNLLLFFKIYERNSKFNIFKQLDTCNNPGIRPLTFPTTAGRSSSPKADNTINRVVWTPKNHHVV